MALWHKSYIESPRENSDHFVRTTYEQIPLEANRTLKCTLFFFLMDRDPDEPSAPSLTLSPI